VILLYAVVLVFASTPWRARDGVLVNRGSTGVDARPWLVAGVLAAGTSLLAYGLVRRPK